MAQIFITGSADGLGLLAAKELIQEGHEVVLHARNERRANETRIATSGAVTVLTGVNYVNGASRVRVKSKRFDILTPVLYRVLSTLKAL